MLTHVRDFTLATVELLHIAFCTPVQVFLRVVKGAVMTQRTMFAFHTKQLAPTVILYLQDTLAAHAPEPIEIINGTAVFFEVGAMHGKVVEMYL
jgi:hypothetical protein